MYLKKIIALLCTVMMLAGCAGIDDSAASGELKYCCKITAPVLPGTDKAEDSRILADYGEVGTAYFEPTWCFCYTVSDANEGHREAVKVNAVTGEITIDKE